MNNWLITGGCGFIGRNLLLHILNSDPHKNIRILDNLSVGTEADLGEICDFKTIHSIDKLDNFDDQNKSDFSTELVIGDIINYQTCLKCCNNIDIVVHLAANTGVAQSVEDPFNDMKTNISGTLNMLEAAKHMGVSRFIFASSGAPLGEVDPPINEKIAPKPVSPYGASKLAGEAYCSVYYRSFNLKTVSLRFGNVYGPYSKHKGSVIANFINRAISDKPCEIFGDGMQTRDFIYVSDLVTAICKAAYYSKDASHSSKNNSHILDQGPENFYLPWGETFQIATFKEHTVKEVAVKIAELFKIHANIDVTFIHAGTRIGDVKRNYADTSKAKYILNWKHTVDLNEGLEKAVRWFINKNILS